MQAGTSPQTNAKSVPEDLVGVVLIWGTTPLALVFGQVVND
jgi:hypothetical protein